MTTIGTGREVESTEQLILWEGNVTKKGQAEEALKGLDGMIFAIQAGVSHKRRLELAKATGMDNRQLDAFIVAAAPKLRQMMLQFLAMQEVMTDHGHQAEVKIRLQQIRQVIPG